MTKHDDEKSVIEQVDREGGVGRRAALGGLLGAGAWVATGCNRAERKPNAGSPRTAEQVAPPAPQTDPVPPAAPAAPAAVVTPEAPPATKKPVNPLRERGAVVQVRDAHALDRRGQPAVEPTTKMVHRAVMELTGTSSPRDAWSRIVSPTDVVGLKPNCFAPRICPVHPATMDAVLEGMKLAGVPDENLLLWDMWHFAKSPIASRYRRRKIKVGFVKSWGYTRRRYRLPQGPPTAVARPLARATKVINLPVLKDHSIAGVTVALKNLTFGSIPKPHLYHGNHCDPGIANVYNLPVFRDKVALTLADGFYLVYDKGPQGHLRTRQRLDSVFATTDPVALDRLAWDLIDRARKERGLPLLMARNTGHSRWPKGRPIHVLTAGRLGLGESDLSKIKLHKPKAS